ncbi:hypothetical protein [Pedococcus dokdonensis]|nr:hypothetical protein [Pedococcus dokdonensis]
MAALVTCQGNVAYADSKFWGNTVQDGAQVTLLNASDLHQLHSDSDKGSAGSKPKFAYASVANCGSNTPDSPAPDDFCSGALTLCAGNSPEQGLGPSVRLFRRTVDAAGKPTGQWVQYGVTCFPEAAPGPARPRVTMAMVLAAFHDTDFAKPSVQIQPKGNVTLVTLPTYFETRWPQAGFEPEEVDQVDPARMAGFRVEIRPKLASITYVYGDGSTSGATTSLGGPYPTGDVTKTYRQPGDFAVRADVTYSGQFRVGGGAWVDIPGTVTIRGSAQTLSVRTAHARLVAD